MLSPLAVTLALAFWAPYNHGQPVCPDGVKIHTAAFGAPSTRIKMLDGVFAPQCEDMAANPSVRFLSVPDQCAWVARNIGWSFFGLPNSTDPRNVMYGREWVTPAACYPKAKRAPASTSALPSPGS